MRSTSSRSVPVSKPAYLELNFYYGGTIGDDPDKRWRVVFVPGYSGDLFHATGNFSQNFAIRNAYAEVENLECVAYRCGPVRGCIGATTSTCSISGRSTT